MIRGPGSAVHGEYGYIGVINVVTRQGANRLFLRAGEDDSYTGGGVFAWDDPVRDFQVSLSISGDSRLMVT